MFIYYEQIKTDPVPTFIKKEATGCPMPNTYLNGRPVYFGDVCLDGTDSFFESATWSDTDLALNDDDLDKLGQVCADHLINLNLNRYGYFKK